MLFRFEAEGKFLPASDYRVKVDKQMDLVTLTSPGISQATPLSDKDDRSGEDGQTCCHYVWLALVLPSDEDGRGKSGYGGRAGRGFEDGLAGSGVARSLLNGMQVKVQAHIYSSAAAAIAGFCRK